jgi:hypothetical protein
VPQRATLARPQTGVGAEHERSSESLATAVGLIPRTLRQTCSFTLVSRGIRRQRLCVTQTHPAGIGSSAAIPLAFRSSACASVPTRRFRRPDPPYSTPRQLLKRPNVNSPAARPRHRPHRQAGRKGATKGLMTTSGPAAAAWPGGGQLRRPGGRRESTTVTSPHRSSRLSPAPRRRLRHATPATSSRRNARINMPAPENCTCAPSTRRTE